MAVNTSVGSDVQHTPVHASMSKYAKIQPAIAIKPKPAVQVPAQKPAFNPRYDPSSQSKSTLLHDEVHSNINTLRKWVLPPRPRPGRKPTATLSNAVPATVADKSLCKKKPKVQKRDEVKPTKVGSWVTGPGAGTPGTSAASSSSSPGPIGIGLDTPTRMVGSATKVLLQDTFSGRQACGISPASTLATMAMAKENSDPGVRPLQPAPKQISDLQTMYLARLKEQELIRNYIEVLTNQIKELKFVQSGVITFDALNSDRTDKPKLASLLPSEQLDHINNVNDLDKFLAHLTTQSNVIHSVTKKFVGSSLNQDSHLQLQIRYYLELRAKNSSTNASRSLESPKVLLPQLATPKTSSSFTPSLLRPLKMNLFDAEDDIIDVDILNEGDSLLPNSGMADRLKFEIPPLGSNELDFFNLSGSPEQKAVAAPQKMPKKNGCGFCNGGTPCVCFDADNIFGVPK